MQCRNKSYFNKVPECLIYFSKNFRVKTLDSILSNGILKWTKRAASVMDMFKMALLKGTIRFTDVRLSIHAISVFINYCHISP